MRSRSDQLRVARRAAGFIVYAIFLSVAGLLLLNTRTPAANDLSNSALLAERPAVLSRSLELTLASIDCGASQYEASDVATRINSLVDSATRADPDVIALRRVPPGIRDRLVTQFVAVDYPYHHHFTSGLLGSGLLLVSRHPVQETFFHRFTENGRWYRPERGGWWWGNGIGLARIELPNIGPVDVFICDLNSSGAANRNESKIQMGELGAFVRAAATGTSPAFVVGAFKTEELMNLEPDDSKPELLAKSRSDELWFVGDHNYTAQRLETPASGPARGIAATIRVDPNAQPGADSTPPDHLESNDAAETSEPPQSPAGS